MVNAFYVLTISRRGSLPGLYSFYPQGIPNHFMNFNDIATWKLTKRIWTSKGGIDICLNRYLIAFQRLWRAYKRLLRRVRNPRFFLERERVFLERPVWPPPIGTLYATAVSTSGAT